MARRVYSNTPGYRATSDSSYSKSQTSSSLLSSRTSSTTTSATFRSVLDPPPRSSGGRVLLTDRGDTSPADKLSSDSSTRLSPKPIRRYGRTTHSQAFASSQSSSTSASSVDPSSPTSQTRDWRLRARGEESLATRDRQTPISQVENSPGIYLHERQRVSSAAQRDAGLDVPVERSRYSARNENNEKNLGAENSESNEGKQRIFSRKSRTERSLVQTEGSNPPLATSELDTFAERPRPIRPRDDQADTRSRTVSSAALNGEQARRGGGGSGRELTETDILIQVSNYSADNSARLRDTITSQGDSAKMSVGASLGQLSAVGASLGQLSAVGASLGQLSAKSGVTEEYNTPKGIQLEEPSPTLEDRFSRHLSNRIPSQWTEDDLDAFVRQLSNPQHPAARGDTGSPRSAYDRNRSRGPLLRAETDIRSSTIEVDSNLLDKERTARSWQEDPEAGGVLGGLSGAGGVISGLSGLRLIKNKKVTRSSHATAKRYAMRRSKEMGHVTTSTFYDHEFDSALDGASCPDRVTPSPDQGTPSPEGSEGEAACDRLVSELAAADVKEASKKRRFRKMLTRPLNRSQSAGCAKDVPAHAQFLEQQRQKSKEAEWPEPRSPRDSAGDIHHPALTPDDEEEEEDLEDEEESSLSLTPSDSRVEIGGRVHKTKSADAAMLVADDLAVLGSHKSKPRTIAKKISRKMMFLRRRHTDSTLGAGREEGARRLADVDPQEAREWSKSFENLLFDKTGLELFRGFLLTEHSSENIDFWIACQNYKNVKSSKQLPSLALKIFNNYVAVQSKKEINLDSKTRTYTYESVTSNPTRQTFDEAQRRVQALMEKDSYRRFLESEVYQDLAAGNIQHKS